VRGRIDVFIIKLPKPFGYLTWFVKSLCVCVSVCMFKNETPTFFARVMDLYTYTFNPP
jgi:hypothetical protein